MHSKQNPPWVQHGVQRISGGNNCCRGHTRPKWMVLTFAPMLWCIWQHHNFCCHSGAVLGKGWSLPWQNLASIGPQDCQGWLVWIPWSDKVYSEKMPEPPHGTGHPLTANTRFIRMNQEFECLPEYMRTESLIKQYPVVRSELSPWVAWPLMGPRHPQAQWRPNSSAWNMDYNVYEFMWIRKPWQNNILLGDQLCLWMSWHLRDQHNSNNCNEYVYV